MTDLELMIILIEGEYSRECRNTSTMMRVLLLKEFGVNVSEDEILKFYGITEDYEFESDKIEYG